MASVTLPDDQPAPPVPLMARLTAPRTLIILGALTWVPLVAYVMFGASRVVLLPAIPAILVLYLLAMINWRESTVALIGATLVCFWLFIAVAVPFMPLIDPNEPIQPFVLPFTEARDQFFWLGTDFRGRDMLSRALWGCQRVIVWGVTATAVAYVIGTTLGLIAGYLAGWWDELISFIGNVILSFPVMVLFIVILTYFGPSGFNIIVAVTFASAPAIMRIVRGLTLDIKSRDYVFAAQTRGEKPFWIMVVELLPNARGPIIVDACLRLGYTTVAITTLTFLGLGLQPPDPDWGLMIKEAASSALLFQFSYMLLVPALSVSSLILGFNLLADGLREMSLRD